MKTIYFHIGTHKTGSTTIQHYMEANRVSLQELGVSYPNVHIVEKAHHLLAGQLIRDAGLSIFKKNEAMVATKTPAADRWQELKQHIEHTDYQTILISSEEFEWLTTPEIVPKLIGEGYLFKIIIFVRRQDRYLESLYQQFVKDSETRLSLTIEQWCQNVLNTRRYHDYLTLINRWGGVFGHSNLRIVNFDDAVANGIERTFLSAIGVDQDAAVNLKMPEKTWLQRQKEGLDVRCVEYLRWSNKVAMTSDKHNSILSALMNVSDRLKEKGEFERYYLTPKARTWIIESVRESNEEVKKRYFSGHGQLFEEPTEQGRGVDLGIKPIIPLLMEQWKI